MDIVGISIKKPVSVLVGVILVVLFGLIGLSKLPIQLTPDVETPQITVRTNWGGATPYEVEQEVVERQEEVLKGLQGLTKMESSSYNNYGEITLSFSLETNVDDGLLRVSNKLNEISNYPENVDEPVIESSGANSSPVIWMVLEPADDNPIHINKYRTYFEDSVRQHLERVRGVGSLFVFGGTVNELHVTLDMEALARYGLSIPQVIGAINHANETISAGVMGVGRKNYRIRTVSRFQSPADPLDVVITDDGQRRVYLRDVAAVSDGNAKESVSVLHNGNQVIVVGVRKEQGANVLAMTDELEAVIERVNGDLLAERGLHIRWVYDQRPYINTAISLVKKNVLIGGLLAVGVLLLFLRSLRLTLTTALAIPISAISTFVILWLSGRSLNVVSLAGISFAIGMLVDNAIVVLENIDRHRKMGKNVRQAALDGAREVWGAIFASTATTIAVFLPVIFMQEEAGQLFRDIAIAITFSIMASFLVSISVIPTLVYQLYKKDGDRVETPNRFQRSPLGTWLAGRLMRLSNFTLAGPMRRITTVIVFVMISVGLIASLMPSAEYLPQGNRNLILNILVPPPGYSTDKLKEMGRSIYAQAEPHFTEDGLDGIPQLKQMFFVGADRFTLFGAIGVHETRAPEMMPLLRRIINSMPGVFGVSIQAGIFQSGIGEGRTVEVNISGTDVAPIIAAGRTLYGAISGAVPGAQVRPVPSLEDSYPEVRILPRREQLASNGLNESDLGSMVDILMDGRIIGEYGPDGVKQVNLVLKGSDQVYDSPESLLATQVVNGAGQRVLLADLSDVEYTQGMPQINHLERKRTITLQVTPPADVPLQDALNRIEQEVVAGLQQAGQLAGVEISIGGNADKLSQTREALQWNLLLAVVITYLLMSALFESFLYPLIILVTVPLAAAGGFVGIRLVDVLVAPQAFDILAMLGFIILVGTVVNNAILIVHQSLNNVRYHGMIGINAVSEAVRTRIRPIFMSATTSLLGMLPLVLSTGSGSELYRGLGSILLGGLALSTVFTLFVIPALLAFAIGRERSRVDESI
ncbi:MAG: efflux RND transporter permease subunit [Desulfobulbaceae bacterium]|uniref:Efflux RND transporter permease subunit n=1 Tax=Candidatus Desulfatifera sulfidica TaxID=2841691 RepID=A0A8J6N890_9BACT|nr:efflux RND transporter permease subunit [Candidatus Desulfatifera sulfidica]